MPDTFETEITLEIDRLETLYSHPTTPQRSTACSPWLECPGLGIVASRSPATRRALLASMVKKSLIGDEIDIGSKVVVFANATAQLLMRDVIAAASGLNFSALDCADVADDEWPSLLDGINSLNQGAGAAFEGDTSVGVCETPTDIRRVHWSTGPAAASDVLKALAECPSGSSIFVENTHLLSWSDKVEASITKMRNSAAATGNFLYVAIGLSHWPDIRKTNPWDLFLTDLPESHAFVVDIADKITLLAPCPKGLKANIFDPRYAEPQRGLLHLKCVDMFASDDMS